VLLVRRPDEGLLGGMAALPTTPWRDAPWTAAEARAFAPADVDWTPLGAVRHVFTHFALTLDVWRGDGDGDGVWVDLAAIRGAGLPTVFLKAATLG
jgi:A/G-specific adenine glycosylase